MSKITVILDFLVHTKRQGWLAALSLLRTPWCCQA